MGETVTVTVVLSLPLGPVHLSSSGELPASRRLNGLLPYRSLLGALRLLSGYKSIGRLSATDNYRRGLWELLEEIEAGYEAATRATPQKPAPLAGVNAAARGAAER